MNLGLIGKEIKHDNFIKKFINELQSYLNGNLKENSIRKGYKPLIDFNNNENKLIVEYRDKMLIERNNILNNYANNTVDKGQMYYIYSKSSKNMNEYNLCICNDENSHTVIEERIENLPEGASIGSVLRKSENGYILDEESTIEIENQIRKMIENLLDEQAEFLKSKRIEEHIYEVSEKNDNRVWLFDITNNSNEAIEEIDFPKMLINESKEGDLFVYKEGRYQRYS